MQPRRLRGKIDIPDRVDDAAVLNHVAVRHQCARSRSGWRRGEISARRLSGAAKQEAAEHDADDDAAHHAHKRCGGDQ